MCKCYYINNKEVVYLKFWNKGEDEILNYVESNLNGLSSAECEKRILKYGKNELPKKKPDSFFTVFFRQLLDPIVILLIITIFFCLLINEYIDAIAITFIVFVDLLMGTFQEWKANKTAQSLSNLINVKVNVLRDNKEITLDSTNLTIGDIVFLQSGDKISADMRILECHNLQVDEATLTGESTNEHKKNDILDENVPLADRVNMVFAGTSVVTGRAKCVVVKTGINTEIGKIAHEVIHKKDEKSPLTIRMEKFSKQISILIVFVAIVIALLLVYKGIPGSDIFLSVIALSVSAMPEGLPLALTMALTISSNKMAKNNVIVKKLNSVESLGSCTVIASDKTGTLTVDEQTAKKIILPNGTVYNVSGTGYNNIGEITGDEKYLNDALSITFLGYLNNEAGLSLENGKFVSYGDSIDIAFLSLYQKSKLNKEGVTTVATIPYESENKYSAVFYKEKGKTKCTVKGSLEVIMSFCKGVDKEKILSQNESLAKEGYRVIALADGEINDFKEKDFYDKKDINNLTFCGLVGFIDPVREDVYDSLMECKTAGIKVVMITGDHPLTAYSIAKRIKIASSFSEVATASDVEEAYEKGFSYFDEFVKSKTVFTRVTPLDKLKIVESYKRQGEFIAVTGDGVNDAPALKSANISIAMGSGTDVAKETASMIITDNSFNSIVLGVKEGRCAYSNIRKVSYMLLSSAFAEVSFFLLAILADLPMPLVAIQLLWLNIVTDGLQDFALSFEKEEKGLMKEKPRDPKESIFNRELLSEVILSGLVTGLIVFGVWVYLINVVNMDENVARGYVMALMVFMQNVHVLNCRSERESAFKIPLKNNPLVAFSIISAIILQMLIMEVPILSHLLKVEPVPILDMIKLFLLSLIVLFVMEVYKKILKKH